MESCKQEILELDLGDRFFTFAETDQESTEVFKVCQQVNRVVFDFLLPKADPLLLVDHVEYILNQGL